MTLALGLAAGSPTDAPPVRICNAMPINLTGFDFEVPGSIQVVGGGELKPGKCRSVFGISPGDYTLEFNERAPDGDAAMCRRLCYRETR